MQHTPRNVGLELHSCLMCKLQRPQSERSPPEILNAYSNNDALLRANIGTVQEEAASEKSEVNNCYYPAFLASTLKLNVNRLLYNDVFLYLNPFFGDGIL